MTLQELILDSEELLDKIHSNENNIDILIACNLLGVSVQELHLLFEYENILIRSNSISTDLFKQVLFKESEISQPPNILKGLINSSNELLQKINSDIEYIRVSKLCKLLNINVRFLINLLELEGVVIDKNPNSKIEMDDLKRISDLNLPPRTQITLKEIQVRIKLLDKQLLKKNAIIQQFIRSEQVKIYAKMRAKGVCELCENPAPFDDKYGVPFLEVHHIIFLSEGGKDNIDNVAALCPNCHRKIHNLALENDVDKLLNLRKE